DTSSGQRLLPGWTRAHPETARSAARVHGTRAHRRRTYPALTWGHRAPIRTLARCPPHASDRPGSPAPALAAAPASRGTACEPPCAPGDRVSGTVSDGAAVAARQALFCAAPRAAGAPAPIPLSSARDTYASERHGEAHAASR